MFPSRDEDTKRKLESALDLVLHSLAVWHLEVFSFSPPLPLCPMIKTISSWSQTPGFNWSFCLSLGPQACVSVLDFYLSFPKSVFLLEKNRNGSV